MPKVPQASEKVIPENRAERYLLVTELEVVHANVGLPDASLVVDVSDKPSATNREEQVFLVGVGVAWSRRIVDATAAEESPCRPSS